MVVISWVTFLKAKASSFLGLCLFAKLFLELGYRLLFELCVSLLEGVKLCINKVYHGEIAIEIHCLAVWSGYLIVHRLQFGLNYLLAFLLDVGARFVDFYCNFRA